MPDSQEFRDDVISIMNHTRNALACRHHDHSGGPGSDGREQEVPDPDGTDAERPSKRR